MGSSKNQNKSGPSTSSVDKGKAAAIDKVIVPPSINVPELSWVNQLYQITSWTSADDLIAQFKHVIRFYSVDLPPALKALNWVPCHASTEIINGEGIVEGGEESGRKRRLSNGSSFSDDVSDEQIREQIQEALANVNLSSGYDRDRLCEFFHVNPDANGFVLARQKEKFQREFLDTLPDKEKHEYTFLLDSLDKWIADAHANVPAATSTMIEKLLATKLRPITSLSFNPLPATASLDERISRIRDCDAAEKTAPIFSRMERAMTYDKIPSDVLKHHQSKSARRTGRNLYVLTEDYGATFFFIDYGVRNFEKWSGDPYFYEWWHSEPNDAFRGSEFCHMLDEMHAIWDSYYAGEDMSEVITAYNSKLAAWRASNGPADDEMKLDE